MKRLFNQFSFQVEFQPRRSQKPAPSMKVGSWDKFNTYRAAFDNPDLVVCCVGDGEAETGPLATSWHSNKFSPITDGAVLPSCI